MQVNLQLNYLPLNTGVYFYYDLNNKLLYIGKAKNIRKRITCFLRTKNNNKNNALITRIKYIKWILTKNEYEALILEIKLIKKLRPLFNISLKDDKEYPYICILKEKYPRIIVTKNIFNTSNYRICYGPYLYTKVAKIVLDFIKYIYPIRNCDLFLDDKHIISNNYNKCIQFYIKKCKAPCVGLQSEKDYMQNIYHIQNILSKDLTHILNIMYNNIGRVVNKLNFEYADILKKDIIILEQYINKLKKNPKSIIYIE
jgi:excinuclease ABC subunit C